MYAGVNGAADARARRWRSRPRRVRAWCSRSTAKTVLRGGYGLFWAPWNYGAINSVGYSATTQRCSQNANQPARPRSTIRFRTGFSSRPATRSACAGASGDISFVRSEQDRAARAAVLDRPAARIAAAMSVGVGYTGARGNHLCWRRDGQRQHQPARSSTWRSAATLTQQVPNPFFGNPARRRASPRRRRCARYQLLGRSRSSSTSYMQQSTAANRSTTRRDPEFRKRVTDVVGRQLQLHLQPAEGQPDRAGQLLPSAPGLLDNYNFIQGSEELQPGRDYGRQPGGSPHKVAIAPTVQLPFGVGRAHLNKGGWLDGWSAAGSARGHPDAERLPDRRQPEPTRSIMIGGNQRPNIVDGPGLRQPRQHHPSSRATTRRRPVSQRERVHPGAGEHDRQRPAHPVIRDRRCATARIWQSTRISAPADRAVPRCGSRCMNLFNQPVVRGPV